MFSGGGNTLSVQGDGFLLYAQDEGISGSPTALDTQAEDIESKATSVSSVDSAVDRAHRLAVASSHGELRPALASATEAPSSRAARVTAVSYVASGALRLFGEGVRDYNGKTDALRAEFDERRTEILASDCGVADASYPADATASERSSVDVARTNEIDGRRRADLSALIEEFTARQDRARVHTVDEAAGEAAAALRLAEGDPAGTERALKRLFAGGFLPSGVPAMFPHLRFSYRELPSDLADLSDQELAEHLVDHPELAAGLVGVLDKRVERLIGKELAERYGADEGVSASRIEELSERLDAFGRDVRIQFVAELGGADTLRLLDAVTPWVEGRDARLAEDFTRDLRAAVSEATRYLPEADARQLADEFVDAIGEYTLADETEHATYDVPPPIALSYLLTDTEHGTAFLDTLGDRLDAFEREGVLPGVAIWRSLVDPMHLDSESTRHLFAADDREAAFDPMAAYMSALAKNPDAALQFFTEGASTGPVDVSRDHSALARQEYWLRDRGWGHDDFDSLLAALDAATTDEDLLAEQREKSAGLMSSVVDLLSHRAEKFPDNDDEHFDPGSIGRDGTISVAHMLGTYLPAVDVALDDGAEEASDESQAGMTQLIDERGLDRFGLMPVFEAGEVAELLEVAASSDEGLASLRGDISTHEANQWQHALAHPDDHDLTEDLLKSTARLEGFAAKQVGDSAITDGANKDDQVREENARRSAFVTLGEKAVEQLVKQIPGVDIVGEPLVKFGADQVRSAIEEVPHYAEEARDAAEAGDQAARDSALAAARQLLQRFDHLDADARADLAADFDAYYWSMFAEHHKDGGGRDSRAAQYDEYEDE